MAHRVVYAGVGARETPDHVLIGFKDFARRAAASGWVVRTGGARGADTAFHEGAGDEHTELYLPDVGYNGHRVGTMTKPTKVAYEIAAKYHPMWERLAPFVKRLMARNVHIVLGEIINEDRSAPEPSLFVVCFTPTGQDIGGTGHTCKVARAYGIPVFNVCEPGTSWLSAYQYAMKLPGAIV